MEKEIEKGSASLYVELKDSNISVYHGDSYWLKTNFDSLILIENAANGSWNEIWDTIKSIKSTNGDSENGSAGVYILLENGNIYVLHGEDVSLNTKTPKLLYQVKSVKKDSWEKIRLTLENLKSIK
jgi:hypothetical protein